MYFCLKSYKLTVTEERIYGQLAWGKHIDIPLNSVKAAGTCFFKGVAISTPSGNVKFMSIQNFSEIQKVISELILNRPKQVASAPVSVASSADELKKYKELLDMGAITQEDFDAKKKQLLDL